VEGSFEYLTFMDENEVLYNEKPSDSIYFQVQVEAQAKEVEEGGEGGEGREGGVGERGGKVYVIAYYRDSSTLRVCYV
jgi:hypothetical protein